MILITHNLGVVAEVADKIAIMYAGKVVESRGHADNIRKPASSIHKVASQTGSKHQIRKRFARMDSRLAPRPFSGASWMQIRTEVPERLFPMQDRLSTIGAS